jgi:4-amino-4-deoxy-L-arabinose transferase-like glycosyltransferase
MDKLKILIVALLVTGAATLIEGLLGAVMTPGPVAMVATAIAAVVVWRTGKPLVGLLVAAWLALGPFAMPWSVDNLNHDYGNGVFVFTVVQLIANATAVAVGILAQIEHSKNNQTAIR